jgi:hypothetical protein
VNELATQGTRVGGWLLADESRRIPQLMDISLDRRTSVRHAAVSNQAAVRMPRAGGREIGATVMNISRSGALIRMPQKPALGQLLGIRLVRPLRSVWVVHPRASGATPRPMASPGGRKARCCVAAPGRS